MHRPLQLQRQKTISTSILEAPMPVVRCHLPAKQGTNMEACQVLSMELAVVSKQVLARSARAIMKPSSSHVEGVRLTSLVNCPRHLVGNDLNLLNALIGNLQDWARRASGGSNSTNPGARKRIVYGSTDIVNAEAFLKELARLGKENT